MDQQRPRTVEDFRRWAHAVANSLAGPADPRHDDLVQEALLAIWLLLAEPDGTRYSATYLATAGRHAMIGILRGGAATGSRGGQHYRPKTSELPDAWLTGDRGPESRDPSGYVEDWMLVSEALAALSPEDRELAVRWASGYSFAELSEGRGRTYAHGRFTKYVLPAMREALAERSGMLEVESASLKPGKG